MPALLGVRRDIEAMQALWGRLYRALDELLGPTCTQLPLGDPTYGLATATTFTGRRKETVGLAPTWTWSEAPSAFDAPLRPTWESSYQGIIPILELNGSDEEADTPDAAYWTSASGFSLALWILLDDITSVDLLGRWDLTTGSELREFRLFVDSSSQLSGVVYDETANAQIGQLSARALVAGRWYHLAMTYGGGTTSTSVRLYVNGARDDTATSASGAFVAKQNTATLTRLGMNIATGGGQGSFFNGKLAGGPAGPLFEQAEWTPMAVRALYEKTRAWMALP